jgi:hypothetical protein
MANLKTSYHDWLMVLVGNEKTAEERRSRTLHLLGFMNDSHHGIAHSHAVFERRQLVLRFA